MNSNGNGNDTVSNDNFWINISLNTWIAKVPGGWIVRVVDVRTEADNNENEPNNNKRVPVTMSSDMIFITDPSHGWIFNNFRWYSIAKWTWRAKVAGVWIVKNMEIKDLNYMEFDQPGISTSMVFVPDQTFSWALPRYVPPTYLQQPQQEQPQE